MTDEGSNLGLCYSSAKIGVQSNCVRLIMVLFWFCVR